MFPTHLPIRVSQASACNFSSPYQDYPLNSGIFQGLLELAGTEVGMEGIAGDHQPLFLFLGSVTCGPSDRQNEVGEAKGSFSNLSLPFSPRIPRLVDLDGG